MQNLHKTLAVLLMGMGMAGLSQAGDMNSAVTYSLGEFDRVGAYQPAPKIQKSDYDKSPKTPVAGAHQTAQDRQLVAQKAEFLRRMFWLALVSR